jgi:hypothetical protein
VFGETAWNGSVKSISGILEISPYSVTLALVGVGSMFGSILGVVRGKMTVGFLGRA